MERNFAGNCQNVGTMNVQTRFYEILLNGGRSVICDIFIVLYVRTR